MKTFLFVVSLQLIFLSQSVGQKASPDTAFKPGGKFWGYTFGDFYYKAHSDTLKRGGANQYTGIEKGRNAFQLRRIYLGYNYDLHPKFSLELLLAAEDNIAADNGTISGDLTINNKLTFFIKYANLRWKNIWKGTDLVLGQSPTPAYPLIVDPVWNYRSVERTVTDIRRTPAFDLGIALQGKFDPEKGNFGYNVMVGNGTGARPENDKFKWFYGEVYAKLFSQKIILDFYADYQRMNWSPAFKHSRNMLKGFVAYTTPKFTVGIEAFLNNNKNDIIANYRDTNDTLTGHATAISTFARGVLVKDKLAYFARFDHYNPNAKYSRPQYMTYKSFSPSYDPNNKENFITAGLDFTPVKNVHFIPNIWYNKYVSLNTNESELFKQDYDLVYRITFHYIFGR